jgi:hypothetical protein
LIGTGAWSGNVQFSTKSSFALSGVNSATWNGNAGGDNFGGNVAISKNGTTVLILSLNSNGGKGACYIYEKNVTNWSNTATLTNSNSNYYLGTGIALSPNGSIALIQGVDNRGADLRQYSDVYVYKKGSAWNSRTIPDQTITGYDNTTYKFFGSVMAFNTDGNTVLIGSPPARVSVFTIDNSGNLAFLNYITDPDSNRNNGFANNVAISGDGLTALISSPTKTFGGNSYFGAAFFYRRSTVNSTDWTKKAEMQCDGTSSNYDSYFAGYGGMPVALSYDGTAALIALPNARQIRRDPNTSENRTYGGVGVVLYYTCDASYTAWTNGYYFVRTWGYVSDLEYFGNSIAMNNNATTILIGASGVNGNQGGAYMYNRSSPSIAWTGPDANTSFTPSLPVANDYYGGNVAMNGGGDIAVISAYGRDTGATDNGSVYLYT